MKKPDPEYVKVIRMRKEHDEYTYKWETGSDKLLKITKSSLGTFGFCPASYKYSYLEDIRQATSPAMIKGTVIHNAQEEFWKMVDIDEAKKVADDPMELQKHFRGLYPEAPEEDYEDIYRAMTAYNTERFIECIEEDVIDNFIPVGNEIMLNARYTTEDGQVVHLQGIIDRIFYEDGGYIPMELKTGAWKDTKKTMMRKEMAFYKLLFENADPDDIRAAGLDPDIPFTHWGWYYPASNYVWVEKVSNRSEQAMHRSMKKLLNAYQEQEFDFEYYYKKCIHCGHYDHCEAAAGGSQYEWF
jgi:hypothetical protein